MNVALPVGVQGVVQQVEEQGRPRRAGPVPAPDGTGRQVEADPERRPVGRKGRPDPVAVEEGVGSWARRLRSATSSPSRARKRPTSNAGSPWPKPSKSRKPGCEPSSRTWAGRNAPWTGVARCCSHRRARPASRGAPGRQPGCVRGAWGPASGAAPAPSPALRPPSAAGRSPPRSRAVRPARRRSRPGPAPATVRPRRHRIRDQVGERPVPGEGALQERPVAGEVAQAAPRARNAPASQPALPQGTHPRVGRGAAVTAGGLGDDPPRPGRVGVRGSSPGRGRAWPAVPACSARGGGAPPRPQPRSAALAQRRLQQRPDRGRVRQGRERGQPRVAVRRGHAEPEPGEQHPLLPGAGPTRAPADRRARTTVRTPLTVTTSASRRIAQARPLGRPAAGRRRDRARRGRPARSGRAAPQRPRRDPGTGQPGRQLGRPERGRERPQRADVAPDGPL